VRTQPSELKKSPKPFITQTILVCIVCLLLTQSADADQQSQVDQPSEPIHITADRLVSDSNNNNAEFTGKVQVIQGQTKIDADRLKLFYKDSAAPSDGINTGNLKTIEAYGNVRIQFDNRVAVGQKAVYITQERKLVLTGPGAKITLDPDVVEGDRIIFYRGDGRVEVKGGVKAKIHSDQRDLN
jgi:lipopolysaccharide export system protein LptA